MNERCGDWRIVSAVQRALELADCADKAVTIDGIAVAVGVPRRMVEIVIEEHAHEFPFPIVAGHRGLWRPTKADEINHYQASLRSRCIQIFRRRRTQRRKAQQAGFEFRGGRFFDPPAMQTELFNTTEPTAQQKGA